MKTKFTILIILTAIITLSFSFVATNSSDQTKAVEKPVKHAPIGGFVSER